MYIIVAGDLSNGYSFYGPFEKYSEAKNAVKEFNSDHKGNPVLVFPLWPADLLKESEGEPK